MADRVAADAEVDVGSGNPELLGAGGVVGSCERKVVKRQALDGAIGAAGGDGRKIGIGCIITLRIEGNASTFVLELIGVVLVPDITDGEGSFPAFEIFCVAEGRAAFVLKAIEG
jgi:hypothetical protein